MNIVSSVNGMNSLQVVMSYATDYQYRLRCLPGFVNKKYLNKYVFDGSHMPDYRSNEFYIGHQGILLNSSGDPGTKEQLYGLFHQYGIDQTFEYLSAVAKTSADSFLVHKNLYYQTFASDRLALVVEQNIENLIKDCFSDNSNHTITEVVTGITYALLQNVAVFMKKK